MNSTNHKFKPIHIVLTINLLLYSAFTVTTGHYQRLTGDSTLYLSIAEKYLRGDLSNAVNGYWGPLLSWLLIPFLYFGSSHIFAINALDLLFGLLSIIGVWRISYKFDISEKIRILILSPLVPILLFISLIEPMDFLLLAILIFYLNIIFGKEYPSFLSHGIYCGILGAFAYFAKPYGFPFFISHFMLMNACHYYGSSLNEQRKKVLRNAVAGFLIFSLVSGIWIALISNKYQRFTFSNMGSGVFASLGPESVHTTLEKGDPIFFEGFFEPPNESAFVVYEDPSYARKKTWSPLGSSGLLKHFIANFTENIFESFRIYESFSRLSISIVIIYILIVFSTSLPALFSNGNILYPFLTIMLYTAGYSPFHFEARYLWIVNILLLLMGGKALHELFRTEFFKNAALKNILAGFFIASFVLTPVKSVFEIGRHSLNEDMHMLGTELGRRYEIRGNIASNRQKVDVSTHDAWHRTFRLSYWLKSRYYGQAKENIGNEELEAELKKFDIDYYFFWGDPDTAPPFLAKYRELTGGEIPDLAIYDLNDT